MKRRKSVHRGEIRWLRFSNPSKRRPALVLGRADSLAALSQIPVIPLSTQIRGLPWEVRLSSEDGLTVESVLKPEWVSSIERTELGPLITELSPGRWDEVRNALLLALGFEDA